MKKLWPYLFIFLTVLVFFRPFVLNRLLPIPADTIVGLYNPFRDALVSQYPRGFPFKNFLITDPIRQQYPWRYLSVTLEKQLQLSLWNPYTLSGTPLLANQQSAPLYPLNILLFLLPFSFGWSLLILLQPLLGGVFFYLYVRNLRLKKIAALLGSMVFAFSGFSIAWMQWGTLVHVGLWLPLLLLSIDKIYVNNKNKLLWYSIYFLALICSFLAGHLQTFFYVFLVAHAYLASRWWKYDRHILPFFWGISFGLVALCITSISWIPVLQFISLSARDVDLTISAGWYIPWQHLIQFIAPDFFGNPTTLNYWSIFNYGEFVGYIGILPLLLALYSVVYIKRKIILFYSSLVIISLLFALPTFLAQLPLTLHIPLLGTSQPTRLLFVTDFALSVLAAFGMDAYMKSGRRIFYPISVIGIFLGGLWVAVIAHAKLLPTIEPADIFTARHNLYIPTALFLVSGVLLIGLDVLRKRISHKVLAIFFLVVVIISVGDLIRFGTKFEPFVSNQFLFPNDTLLTFLQKNAGAYRIMATDSRIFPPNFSIMYSLQSVEGYDPLYIKRYGEFIAALERNKPNTSSPFGFNRIITPHNYRNALVNLLGVKYVLSLDDITTRGFTKVFQEGQTKVYENKNVLPRTFFVSKVIIATSKQHSIDTLFAHTSDLGTLAVVEGMRVLPPIGLGYAHIARYSPNTVTIATQSHNTGFLVLTDTYYPTWHAYIDGKETSVFITDYTFRGILVPSGNHTIVFQDKLF